MIYCYLDNAYFKTFFNKFEIIYNKTEENNDHKEREGKTNVAIQN